MAINLGPPFFGSGSLAVNASNNEPATIWVDAYFSLFLAYTWKLFTTLTTTAVPGGAANVPFAVPCGPIPMLGLPVTIHVDALWLSNVTSSQTTVVC